MKSSTTNSLRSLLLIVFVVASLSGAICSSADKKRAKEYRDVNAIGHRVIGYPTGPGNWYSLDREKEIGIQLSAAFEKSRPLLRDQTTQSYLDRLGQTIARNSDAQLPITIRVVDSEDCFTVTLAGGFQYFSRGLLLRVESEGELAAAIARGVAHTALRSAMGEATRANLLNIPSISSTGIANATSDRALSIPLGMLHFRRKDESAADYFGVQYLYKSGYAPESFISFVQKVWPVPLRPAAKAFDPFPPLQERLDALRKEIHEFLPKQSSAISNTQDFAAFREHLLGVAPPNPLPKEPTLHRSQQRLD